MSAISSQRVGLGELSTNTTSNVGPAQAGGKAHGGYGAIGSKNSSTLEGYLMKLKSKTSLVGSWNKRWFVLNPSKRQFVYYQNEKQRKDCVAPSGGLDFDNITSVKSFDILRFHVESSARTFLLKAKDEEEKKQWVAALNRALFAGEENSEAPIKLATEETETKLETGEENSASIFSPTRASRSSPTALECDSKETGDESSFVTPPASCPPLEEAKEVTSGPVEAIDAGEQTTDETEAKDEEKEETNEEDGAVDAIESADSSNSADVLAPGAQAIQDNDFDDEVDEVECIPVTMLSPAPHKDLMVLRDATPVSEPRPPLVRASGSDPVSRRQGAPCDDDSSDDDEEVDYAKLAAGEYKFASSPDVSAPAMAATESKVTEPDANGGASTQVPPSSGVVVRGGADAQFGCTGISVGRREVSRALASMASQKHSSPTTCIQTIQGVAADDDWLEEDFDA